MRWTWQDARLRPGSLGWLAVMPIVHLLGVIFSPAVQSAPTFADWVLYYQYPFTYFPAFIFWMVSLHGWYHPNLVIRRYRSRLDIVLHQTIAVTVCAWVYTGAICLTAGLLYRFTTGRPVLSGDTLGFVVLFYLCIVLVGVACETLSMWFGRVFASAVVMGIFIADRFTTQIVLWVFLHGAGHLFFTVMALTGPVLILVLVACWRIRGMDILGSEGFR